MGRNIGNRGTSFGDQWYLEQTLKLRAAKLSKHDEQILIQTKLDSLTPILRYSLVIYFIFNTVLLVEDIVHDRNLALSIGRYFVVNICLLVTFIFTFLRLHRTKFFFLQTYFCLIVQTISTSLYMYEATKYEKGTISPFLPLDTFFIYLFVRFNITATVVASVFGLIINEVISVVVGHPSTYPTRSLSHHYLQNHTASHYFHIPPTTPLMIPLQLTFLTIFRFEIANVVLYLICNALGLVSSRIFELNLRNKYFLSKEIEKDRASMESEREKAEKLLYNILPREIADSLKNDFPLLESRGDENGEMNPEKLVNFLNEIFSSFDNLLHEYGLEKIKTIGDAYMFAGGLSKSAFIQTRHGSFTAAEAVAEMALNMQHQVDIVSQKLGYGIQVRVGISSGSVVAGIVGISKFVYDLFGETVNLASKMEASGQPKRVHVSADTYAKLEDKYDFEEGASVDMKDKSIKTYFLLGRKGHMTIAGTKPPRKLWNNTEEEAIPISAPPSIPVTPSTDQVNVDEVAKELGKIGKDDVEVLDAVAHANEEDRNHTPASQRVPALSGDAVIYAKPKVGAAIDGDLDTPGSRAMSPHSRNPLDSHGPILARSGAGFDSRPTSAAHLPLRHHGSASRLEDGVSTNDGERDTSYTAPTLGFKEVLSFNSRQLEIRYRKDYFRKYFRLIQLNSIGGLLIFLILAIMCLSTLPKIDYTVLLVFAIAMVLVGMAVGVFFLGDEGRTYMHYVPVLQAGVAAFGLIVSVVVLIDRTSGYEHHNMAWNASIIMLMFMFVFPGNPFLHTISIAGPAVLGMIEGKVNPLICIDHISDGSLAFPLIVRLLMIIAISVCISYRKEQEARASYYVTQTLDDERKQLTAERSKSERLLYSILPQKIAAKLKMNEGSIADTFHDVTVMFVSIHNFTQLTSSLGPFEKVSLLNKIFSKFDKLVEVHKVEKIKTIGPTYLVVGGLPVPRANHLSSIAELAIDMQEAINNFRAPDGERYKIKAGIHCGKVVAGVIGIYKFSYDLWGDTVNTASRMESHSLPGQIQVTEAAQKKLASRFEFEDRGFIQVKGKGVMHTFFLQRAAKQKTHSNLPNVMPGNFID